jgi:hypothetical protein
MRLVSSPLLLRRYLGQKEGELFILNFSTAVFKNSRECESLKRVRKGEI